MYQFYNTAATQLHASIPGPNSTHACLTLYDVCPHTFHSTASLQSQNPYLHCDLPSASAPRTAEYINRDGTRVVETTRSTLSALPSPHSNSAIEYNARAIEYNDRGTRAIAASTAHHPKEKAMAASLAPLVLSKHSPMMHHIRSANMVRPPRSIPIPSMPAIYLLSFSTDRAPTTAAFARLLNTHLPPSVPLRYTIDARRFQVPSRAIQDLYSGVSEEAQRAVMQDPGARREVEYAIRELMGFVRSGGGETCVAVCCTAGTHRSVGIVEGIAKGVRREVRRCGEEVECKVVVRHVHRVRGRGDPY